MSLETPDKIRNLQRKLYCKAKAEPVFRFYLLYPNQRHRRTGVARLPAVPSCAAPDDDPLNRTESRFADRFNGSFATQSGIKRTCSGHRAMSANDPTATSLACEASLVSSRSAKGHRSRPARFADACRYLTAMLGGAVSLFVLPSMEL